MANPFAAEAADVRAISINWHDYHERKLISEQDLTILLLIDMAPCACADRSSLIHDKAQQVVKTFIHLLKTIREPNAHQRHVLTLLDDILQEDKGRVNVFISYSSRHSTKLFELLFPMLHDEDSFIGHQVACIVAKLASWGKWKMMLREQKYYMGWLIVALNNVNNIYVHTVSRCMQTVVRVKAYQNTFFDLGVISSIKDALDRKPSCQTQYQLVFVVWVMTLDSDIATGVSRYHSDIIPTLADTLGESIKDKVTRLIIGTCRNLLENTKGKELTKTNVMLMVQWQIDRQASTLQTRSIEDPELVTDLEYVVNALATKLEDISSFREYLLELKSGRLVWSPLHMSSKFWAENAHRLMAKKAELLQMLHQILETSLDATALAVACHDVGCFVQAHPPGKRMVDQMGMKKLLMQLLDHDNATVRYEALVATQKLVIQNWEPGAAERETNPDY